MDLECPRSMLLSHMYLSKTATTTGTLSTMKSKDLINEMQQTITELQTELNAEKQNSVDLQKKLNEIAPKWSRLVALRSALTERNAANEALLEELPKGSPCYKVILGQVNLDYIILEYLAIPFGDY